MAISPREKNVIQLISEGHSNKGMSKVLNLSVKTIETHRASAMRKLSVNSTAGLVRYAIRNRWSSHSFRHARATGPSVAIDRADAPAAIEPVDPRQRQRIDDETERALGCDVERDRKCRADRARVDNQDHVACGQRGQSGRNPADLIDKLSPPGGRFCPGERQNSS